MNKNENVFKTSDLSLAATLSLHSPIIFADKTDSRRVSFVFASSPKLDKLIEKYWLGEINIEPQTFANQVKKLKSRIYGS